MQYIVIEKEHDKGPQKCDSHSVTVQFRKLQGVLTHITSEIYLKSHILGLALSSLCVVRTE